MKKIILIFVCLIILVGVGYLFAQPVPTNFWFFTQLFDTPSTYSAGKIVSVNSGATALEFTTPLSSFTGTTSITTLGTIATGVWQGTVIGTTYGGTGAANLNNLITLTTHTTGNYVKSITNGSGITGGDGGSEGAALTIAATLGTSIAAAEMADADHGDVAWSGGVASVEAVGNNSVELGTDTTGYYVATVTDAGNNSITVVGTGTEQATITLDIAADGVELGTDTTGFYVATITDAGNSTIITAGAYTEHATVTLDLAADGVDDTHIDWGSGANQVDLADIAGGTAPANAFDFAGATSLELPNSADPDVDAVGEISVDSDDNSLRGFGDSVQFLYAQLTKTIQFTIAQPDDLDEKDDIPVWSNESGLSFIVTTVKAWADIDNATCVLAETSATNFDAELTIASVTIADDGTSVYYNTTAVVLASGTIDNGNMIIFEPSTQDIEWLKVTILGYFDSDVN